MGFPSCCLFKLHWVMENNSRSSAGLNIRLALKIWAQHTVLPRYFNPLGRTDRVKFPRVIYGWRLISDKFVTWQPVQPRGHVYPLPQPPWPPRGVTNSRHQPLIARGLMTLFGWGWYLLKYFFHFCAVRSCDIRIDCTSSSTPCSWLDWWFCHLLIDYSP